MPCMSTIGYGGPLTSSTGGCAGGWLDGGGCVCGGGSLDPSCHLSPLNVGSAGVPPNLDAASWLHPTDNKAKAIPIGLISRSSFPCGADEHAGRGTSFRGAEVYMVFTPASPIFPTGLSASTSKRC